MCVAKAWSCNNFFSSLHSFWYVIQLKSHNSVSRKGSKRNEKANKMQHFTRSIAFTPLNGEGENETRINKLWNWTKETFIYCSWHSIDTLNRNYFDTHTNNGRIQSVLKLNLNREENVNQKENSCDFSSTLWIQFKHWFFLEIFIFFVLERVSRTATSQVKLFVDARRRTKQKQNDSILFIVSYFSSVFVFIFCFYSFSLSPELILLLQVELGASKANTNHFKYYIFSESEFQVLLSSHKRYFLPLRSSNSKESRKKGENKYEFWNENVRMHSARTQHIKMKRIDKHCRAVRRIHSILTWIFEIFSIISLCFLLNSSNSDAKDKTKLLIFFIKLFVWMEKLFIFVSFFFHFLVSFSCTRGSADTKNSKEYRLIIRNALIGREEYKYFYWFWI